MPGLARPTRAPSSGASSTTRLSLARARRAAGGRCSRRRHDLGTSAEPASGRPVHHGTSTSAAQLSRTCDPTKISPVHRISAAHVAHVDPSHASTMRPILVPLTTSTLTWARSTASHETDPDHRIEDALTTSPHDDQIGSLHASIDDRGRSASARTTTLTFDLGRSTPCTDLVDAPVRLVAEIRLDPVRLDDGEVRPTFGP